MMQEERCYNYDLLRIVCCIAVIVIHVSTTYSSAVTDVNRLGALYTEHIPTMLIWDTMARFAVPCFMMLSGAFLLSDQNKDFKAFYRKSFVKLGIPTLIFSVLYFLFNMLIHAVAVVSGGQPTGTLLIPLKEWLKGRPFYHMWYLYTLIGIYLFIPFLVRIKEEIGEKSFAVVTWLYLPVAAFSGWTSTFTLNWGIAKVAVFLGYVMAGYELRRVFSQRKSSCKGLLRIASGVAIEAITAILKYRELVKDEAQTGMGFSLDDPFFPLTVIASLLIFSGFSSLRIKNGKLRKLSDLTFLIYLFHAGVWTLLTELTARLHFVADCRIMIPISVVTVFLISVGLSLLWRWFWNILERRFSVSERLCKLVRLS